MVINKDSELTQKLFAPFEESKRFHREDMVKVLSDYREELQKSIIPKDIQNALYNRATFIVDYARNDAESLDDATNKAYSILLDFFCEYIFNKEEE